MTKTVTLVLYALVVCIAASRIHSVTRPLPRRYCGQALSTALSLICHSFFNSNKRNMDTTNALEDPADALALDEIPYLFVDRNDAISLVSKRSFRSRHRIIIGVVDECCRKPCTTHELQTYCGSSPDDVTE